MRPAASERLIQPVRALVRSSELYQLLLAAAIGILAGCAVMVMSESAQWLHVLFFAIDPDLHLSAVSAIDPPWRAAAPVLGGVVMGLIGLAFRKRTRPIVDPIEANALHGGRMSINDSLRVAVESVVSNGSGASVGLEAGYTQIGSAIASTIGRNLALRRADLRLAVGCGAASAIAAAFHAPLCGAFYGFELIIGVYTVANVAPVLIAAMAGYLVAAAVDPAGQTITVLSPVHLSAPNYPFYLALGLLLGLVAIGVMRLVFLVEAGFRMSGMPRFFRPVVGGAAVGLMALVSPRILSSGHGALFLTVPEALPIATVALLILLKIAATSISIGSGFRGGMFFASLFLGDLLGKLVASTIDIVAPSLSVDPTVAAIVGMSALSVGIVGGPLTMTFLALESTGDIGLAGVVLAASILSAITVRRLFGYSFSTWRLHLRGETIRNAQDVGWLRELTVGRMMRTDIRPVPATTRIDAFRSLYPLGSAGRIVALDEGGAYAGVVIVGDAFSESADGDAPVSTLLRYTDDFLLAGMTARDAATAFEAAESEELAVVDDASHRHVIGLLTETHLLRRYADELDKARRDLSGGT